MKTAKTLFVSITGTCLALLLTGCMTPKSAQAPAGIRSIQMPSKAATAPMDNRGVNAAANNGGWTSSQELPPIPKPAEPSAPAKAMTPEPELAGSAPTPDQLAREYEAMNAPPKPEPPPEPTSYAPTPIDPGPPSVNLPPSGTPGGPAPFQGSVAVDPAPSAEPVIPSVEDIANQYRALQTAP